MCAMVRIKMRSSCKASLGEISELMNVTAMKLVRVEANNSKLQIGGAE